MLSVIAGVLIFGFGVWVGALIVGFSRKPASDIAREAAEGALFTAQAIFQGRLDQANAKIIAGAKVQQTLFDAWVDARNMALAMGNLAGKSRDQNFIKIEPEYEAWIRSIREFPKTVANAAGKKNSDSPKAS